MQQWTLDRMSESPESTGRASLQQRDTKVFKRESHHLVRRSGRMDYRAGLPGELLLPDPRSSCYNEEDLEEDGEGRRSVPQRLSRHIPQRVGIDMAVSSFNLIASPTCGQQHQQQPTPVASPRTLHGGGLESGRGAHVGPSHVAHSVATGATTAGVSPSLPAAGGGSTATTASAAVSAVAATPSSSAFTSFSESMVSDDSSYLTSLYNDVLADHLIRPRNGITSTSGGGGLGSTSGGGGDSLLYGRGATSPGSLHALHGGASDSGAILHSPVDARGRVRASDSGSEERPTGRSAHADGGTVNSARRGLGGEVLRFADTTSSADIAPRPLAAASPAEGASARVTTYTTKGSRSAATGAAAALLPRVRSRTFYTSGGSGGRGAGTAGPRVFNTTPERVLDAPQFPTNASQLLDWGSNNSIVIGMGPSLYSWNGDSGQAAKVVDLDGVSRIRCVQWVHKCSCVALSVQDGTTAIYDCRSSDFLRTVRLPAGLEVTGLSVNGPVMAVSSDGPHGTTCAFDLRVKEALVATFEGHNGGVASLHYSAAEPFYLATGGYDGSVRVWDARRATAPRYAFDGVHQGSVNVVRWNPQKRSRLFTGGEDGVLCLMDTHAPKRTIEMDSTADEEGGGVGCNQEHLAQYITRAVNTQYPISGLACHGPSGEVVTAHKAKGQLQLRKTSTFHLLSTFTALHCSASLSCLTLAPDKETVCAAQGDDTLKFWRVFDNSAVRSGELGGAPSSDGRAEWRRTSADAPVYLDEPLR